MKISQHYGEGGRLTSRAAEELVNSAYKHDCEDGEFLFPYLTFANLAHIVMLKENKIVPEKEAEQIIASLIEINNILENGKYELDPRHGDIYNNFDVLLRNRIGDVAGWLHTGRPRREAVNVAFILSTRDSWLELSLSYCNLLNTVIQVARNHQSTLMPDFTYLQHAQPTSLAHYLLTFVSTGIRDLQRLEAGFNRLNVSTGGSGSVNGSSLPMSKSKIETLLGFGDIIKHSRDAMWAPDIPLELMHVITSAMMNWSRLAEEIEIWYSKEFNFIELPDNLSRASVIMPHKKNPYPVAYFRGLTTQIVSKLSCYASYGKIYTGNPDSRVFIYGDLPKTISSATMAFNLLSSVMENSKFIVEKLKSSLTNDFSAATDLADFLIMNKKVNYRMAHTIVGKLVRTLINENKYFEDADPALLSFISKDVLGRDISIAKELFKRIINPKNIVESRKTLGGASISQVEILTKEFQQSIELLKERTTKRIAFVTNVKIELLNGKTQTDQE